MTFFLNNKSKTYIPSGSSVTISVMQVSYFLLQHPHHVTKMLFENWKFSIFYFSFFHKPIKFLMSVPNIAKYKFPTIGM
jgi:hypothetical protein